jgi:membrane protein YdbS with pleckstrin-like domain
MRDEPTNDMQSPNGGTRPEGVEPLFDALLAPGAVEPANVAPTVVTPEVALGPVRLGTNQHLDPRHVTVERIGLAVLTAIVSVASLVAGVIVAFTTEPGGVWLLVIAGAWLLLTSILLLCVARWPQLAHSHSSYRVDADGIEIRRGVWWRSVVSVPKSRVQHIDVTQGPLDRRYGLGELVLHTAGNEYAQVSLDGLDHTVALALRDHLLPRGGDDAV